MVLYQTSNKQYVFFFRNISMMYLIVFNFSILTLIPLFVQLRWPMCDHFICQRHCSISNLQHLTAMTLTIISHVIGIFIFIFCFRMLLNQHALIYMYGFHMKPQHIILSQAKCFVHYQPIGLFLSHLGFIIDISAWLVWIMSIVIWVMPCQAICDAI